MYYELTKSPTTIGVHRSERVWVGLNGFDEAPDLTFKRVSDIYEFAKKHGYSVQTFTDHRRNT